MLALSGGSPACQAVLEPSSPFPKEQDAVSLHLGPRQKERGLPRHPFLASSPLHCDTGTSCPGTGGTRMSASQLPLWLTAGLALGSGTHDEGREMVNTPLSRPCYSTNPPSGACLSFMCLDDSGGKRNIGGIRNSGLKPQL